MGTGDFAGKVVAVSGGAGGIGGAIARRFAADGAQLVLIDRDEARLIDVSRTVPRSRIVVCDQRRHEDIERAAHQAGGVDVFVNNAGIIVRKPVVEMATAEISDLLSVNLEGAIRMAVEIGRGMLARKRGVVLNISSQHAFVGAEGRAIYAATKAAMVQFTRSTAAEWSKSGVRVVGLAPGPVESPMTADALKSDEYRRAFLERIPIGRFLSCDEIAEVAFQLCRPGMQAILGHTVLADGGCSLT